MKSTILYITSGLLIVAALFSLVATLGELVDAEYGKSALYFLGILVSVSLVITFRHAARSITREEAMMRQKELDRSVSLTELNSAPIEINRNGKH